MEHTATSKKATPGSSSVPEEGSVTKSIEKQTSKIPSDTFLFAAGGIIIVSLALRVMGKEHKSLFFGQWVAPLLLLGVYNKIVKTLGHDQVEPIPADNTKGSFNDNP